VVLSFIRHAYLGYLKKHRRAIARVAAALLAWSAVIAFAWFIKGEGIGACLVDQATGQTNCPSPDSDLPQLAAWLVGAIVILGVGLVWSRGQQE
jgi:hypothetical protein